MRFYDSFADKNSYALQLRATVGLFLKMVEAHFATTIGEMRWVGEMVCGPKYRREVTNVIAWDSAESDRRTLTTVVHLLRQMR